MADRDEEEGLLHSAALQNARSILTARQRAERDASQSREALRESADRLQLALSAGRLGDWSWTIADDQVVLGARAAEIYGVEPGKTFTRAWMRGLLHEDDAGRARDLLARALAERTDYHIEYRVNHATLGQRWIAATGVPTFAPDGSMTGMIGVVQDIHERKSAEEALLETQGRLTMAIEAGRMGDWEWVIATGQVTWSPALQAIHGLRPGTFGGGFEDFRREIHPDDLENVLANIKRSIDERTEYGIEYRIVKSDGSTAWLEARGKLFFDAQGNPERMAGVCMDITPRKQAEEKLRDESRVLELLNRTGTVLTSNLELQPLVQAVTDAATELSGAKFGAFFYNVTDDKGDSYLLYSLSGAPREAFAKFGQPRATPLFGPTFNGADPIRSDDILSDPRYGKWGPHHGMPPGHLPVRSYLGVPVITRAGEVIGGLFFGHSETGVFDERVERLMVGIAAQAASAIDNARLYEASKKAAQERETLLENERSARAEAERANSMKDEFLATLSHELRTPLNSIMGWSQVLKLGASAADMQRGLDAIERNARVQAQLIEDLLDMSRITSGKVRLDIQPVDPIAIIEAAIETIRPAAQAKQIRVEKLLDPAVGPLYGDPGRLQQVVWNLLSNAVKFTPKDGKVQILLERVNSHIELSVADTGMGIKPEFLPYVFDRFRQQDASTTRSFGGLGLGLAIVKHLVELHGGVVRVLSAGAGKGTTFVVHLPLTVIHRTDSDEPRSHPKSSQQGAGDFKHSDLFGIRVLLVDDEADARELVKHVLAQCDAQVFTAINAEEALVSIERDRPHVLISDIGMPLVDGYELLKRVRELGVSKGGYLPAIALTAFARSEDRTRALRAGFLVHVSKPVEPAELVATVASVVGRAGGKP